MSHPKELKANIERLQAVQKVEISQPARSRRLFSAHRSASTIKNVVALVSKARGIISNPLCWHSSAEAANFSSLQPTSTRTLLLTPLC